MIRYTTYPMGPWTLLSLVTITWLLWGFGTLQEHYIARREGRAKPDSGVSLAPIIPLFPLLFFAAAKMADKVVPPWGTWIIGGIHALLALSFIAAII
jgi:hypothetical protein